MTCPDCGEEARPGQKFCANCGRALSTACASCGATLTGRERFCPECGAPTIRGAEPASLTSATTADAEPRRERRLVSVLFADLVGFTSASEGRDPEATRDFQERYFALCRDVIARYGGTVEKFIGDAVMALWGAPTAHEDDAERAVRAALDLVDSVAAMPGASAARAAVVSGEAAVALGSEGHGMVTGDIVNTAARLQSVADPGTVLVGEATRQAAADAVVFEPAGERELRGKVAPVPAWRAVRIAARPGGAGRPAELEPPFVGRDAELTLLKELFHATARERRMRTASITGQAGIGKSRLAWELRKYVEGLVEPVTWLQGRSPSYGDGITFWALGEMIRQYAGVAETDDATTTRRKLREVVAATAGTADVDRIEAALLALLGAEEYVDRDSGELFGAWRTFLEHLGRAQTLVLVFEDLHWADSGLLDFLEQLLEWSRAHPILVLTLARPELLERRPTWGAGQRNFNSIHLEPLPASQMRDMLERVIADMPGSALRAIVERAEGLPLFAVELVRMLAADGTLEPTGTGYRVARRIERLEIPKTLHGLVAARLDALDAGERSVLQHAAILGQSFTLAALVALIGQDEETLEAHLSSLVRREMLRRETDPRSPERGQYQFVQSVIREVAYATVSRRERTARHLAAARYFEALGDDELAAVLATHYLEAYRASSDEPGADTLAAQARVALRAAGERALQLHALDQAVALFERAASVTTDPADQVALLERAAEAAGRAGRHELARGHLERAIAIHGERGDHDAVAVATARLAWNVLDNGHVLEAIDLLEKAVPDLLPRVGDAERAWLLGQLARAHFLAEHHEAALELCEEALAPAERARLMPVLIDVLVTKGSLFIERRPVEAIALLRGAITLADRQGLTGISLRARNNLGVALRLADPEGDREVQHESLEISRRQGMRGGAIAAATGVIFASIQLGELDRAAPLFAEFDDEDMEASTQLWWDWARAELCAMRGDEGCLERLAARREALASEISHPEWLAADRMNRSYEAFLRGRLDDAAREVERARTILSGGHWPHVLTGVVGLWRRDTAAVRGALDAIGKAPAASAPVVEAEAASLAAGLAALEGNASESIARYRDVRRRWREFRLLLNLTLTEATMVSLLGTAFPEVAAAEREARERATSWAAPGLVALLDRALSMEPVVAVAGGAPLTPGTTPVEASHRAG